MGTKVDANTSAEHIYDNVQQLDESGTGNSQEQNKEKNQKAETENNEEAQAEDNKGNKRPVGKLACAVCCCLPKLTGMITNATVAATAAAGVNIDEDLVAGAGEMITVAGDIATELIKQTDVDYLQDRAMDAMKVGKASHKVIVTAVEVAATKDKKEEEIPPNMESS
ncbi:hypothetical protein XENTR_v10009827 [Xenopus tropicalis]|nr:hypothetical protein XENTR_v10009827 [Xenopus tropicalis]